MTAKKRFRRKQKKWKAWGAAIATGDTDGSGGEHFIPHDVR